MGKLLNKKREFPEEEYEDEELEDIGIGDIEMDDEIDDEEDDEEIDVEDDDDEIDDEDDEDDDDEIDEEEGEEEDDGEGDEGDDEEVDEEESEEDRRFYRHRRRVRNQIAAYAIVLVVIGALAAGAVVIGRNVASSVKKARQAAKMEEQLQEPEEEPEDMVIETPKPVEEEPEVDRLGALVEAYISEMPIEDKVAGMFIITPEALTGVRTATQAGEGTQEALEQYAVGGLIYFSHNIQDREQFSTMLSNTVPKSRYPIFLAVDEEGGKDVSRVANSSIEVTKVDDMAVIGESGDANQAYEAGNVIGSYLKELGINVDFAPVADLASSENSILGARSFGSDAETVGNMVSSMVEGIEANGVSACLKHFPGIGDTTEDTHDGRVEITKTLEEMRATDFISFQAGIDAGADFTMVSHVTASAVDASGVPSSLSEVVITELLRDELGFEGIVITDALDMGAISEYYTSAEAAVMAIEAGADMLLMPEDFDEAYSAVLEAVQNGTISEDRIDESLRRIYRVKCASKLE